MSTTWLPTTAYELVGPRSKQIPACWQNRVLIVWFNKSLIIFFLFLPTRLPSSISVPWGSFKFVKREMRRRVGFGARLGWWNFWHNSTDHQLQPLPMPKHFSSNYWGTLWCWRSRRGRWVAEIYFGPSCVGDHGQSSSVGLVVDSFWIPWRQDCRLRWWRWQYSSPSTICNYNIDIGATPTHVFSRWLFLLLLEEDLKF